MARETAAPRRMREMSGKGVIRESVDARRMTAAAKRKQTPFTVASAESDAACASDIGVRASRTAVQFKIGIKRMAA